MTAIGDPCPFALRTAEFPMKEPVLVCFEVERRCRSVFRLRPHARALGLGAPVRRRADFSARRCSSSFAAATMSDTLGRHARTRVEAGDPTLLGQAIALKHGFTLEARLVPHFCGFAGRGKRDTESSRARP